ncbi:MAG: hypothetical protein KH328_08085 [Staphylococcus sp.]|nr:hypothetical protein [Staphylococcus sp.]
MRKSYLNNMKKRIMISCFGILGVFVLLVLSYVIYISCQYYRIEDNKIYTDEIYNNTQETLVVGKEYAITTYNIGFGAYNHDFSFFMDQGKMLSGEKVKGKLSKATSKEIVLTNTRGAIEEITAFNPDFAFFQEVDTNSTRSFQVNQFKMLQESLAKMASVHVSNFHSAYLFYPILDPHGVVNSGIATFSKYKIDKVIRKSLEITDAFPSKFFDLDRCFSASYLKTNHDNYLVIVNVHLSAYDKGGVYRKKQLQQLNSFLEVEYQKGNYVVCGGDFNHDIANSMYVFETKQEKPEWVYALNNDDLNENFSFATNNNIPTCRSTDMPYEKNVNYTVVLDGFIVSKNVDVIMVENVDTNFEYSDHNPVYMKFVLK